MVFHPERTPSPLRPGLGFRYTHIEQVEADRRDDEEVHGGNLRCVVVQEGPPSLAGKSKGAFASWNHPGRRRGRRFLALRASTFTA